MKKVLGLGVLSVVAMGMLIGVFAGQKNEIKKASAYSTSSLPTTIDLNDTSAANIRSYYSSLNGLDASQRQGTNLLKNLKTILKNGQKYYAYDSGSTIWQIYEITDRDWAKSPASSTTYGTYNSSTNKITGYTYGTNSNSRNNPYIHALYINRNVTNETKAWGNHQQDEWGINREHVWPKSQGFDNDTSSGGARGDPMHLIAGNGYSNNIHSNYFYGYVKTSSSYTNCGTKYSNQNGNLRGTSKTLNTGTVFEPQDCDKGDIARAIFYMAARYNYLSGSDSDGIDENNPNLEILQSSAYSSSSYTSSTTTTGKMGILTDLLAWHHADPVDEYEIHRNNLLYTNYTNNRNPFIDFPEWVDYIWGTATYSGSTYQSYNSNPTGYAKPSSDTINGYNSTLTPMVNSVTVSPDSICLDLNDVSSETLTATVSVSNDASKEVSWSITPSGQGVSVSNGTVTASNDAELGEYTVRATSTFDNTKYGECSVTVINTAQAWEDTLVDATMKKGSTAYDDNTVNGHPAIKVGTQSYSGNMTITVGAGAKVLRFYAAAWNGYPCSMNITGGSVTPSTISLTADTGISGGEKTYTLAGNEEDYLFNLSLSNVVSETEFTLEPSGATRFVVWGAQYSTEVPNDPVTSITATVNKTFHAGETITASDVVVKDNNNNFVMDFDFDNYMFTYDDAPSGGSEENISFIIPYHNLSATLNVPVSRAAHVIPTTATTYEATAFKDELAESYTENQSVTVQGTTFAIDGYYYSSNSKICLSSSYYSAPGSIRNSTAYSKGIVDVSVIGAYPDIQLSTDGSNWIDLAEVTPETVDYYFFRVFFKNTSRTGYVNITRFIIKLKTNENALNFSNYIMYEDTEGQCVSKYDTAEEYFNNMSKSERAIFMAGEGYVISHAYERFIAWTVNQGKTITLLNGDYVISSNRVSPFIKQTDQSTMIVIIAISTISLLAVGMFFLQHKKKEY